MLFAHRHVAVPLTSDVIDLATEAVKQLGAILTGAVVVVAAKWAAHRWPDDDDDDDDPDPAPA